jgi:hypothetical protein
MIFKNIFAKKIGKNGVFYFKQSKNMQKYDHNISFEKTANFYVAENYRKSQKIVIITSATVCRKLLL